MKIREIFKLSPRVIMARFLGHKIPIKTVFYITYKCNLKCPFCYRRTKKSVEMNTFQIKAMMKEFKDMGTYFWVFNGGEPLLRDDLPELIDYAKEIGFHCSLVTNGVLLAEKIRKSAAFKKLDFVQISLEGPEEIHNRMCGEGSFGRIVDALELLKNLKIKTNILTVITKDNIDYFSYLVELVKLNHMTITFQPLGIHREDIREITRTYFPSKIRSREVIEKLILLKKERAPIIPSVRYLRMIRDCWPDTPNRIQCYAGRLYCSITPDGHVTSCCSRLDEAKNKNFGPEIGFKKSFKQLDDTSGCQDCYYFGPQELNIILETPTLISLMYITK